MERVQTVEIFKAVLGRALRVERQAMRSHVKLTATLIQWIITGAREFDGELTMRSHFDNSNE